MDTRPFRSVLYIPGSKDRALDKARSLATDAIIFDLEDAVAPDEKANARRLLADTLQKADYGPRAKLVRINGFDTDWAMADLDTLAAARPEAILLPKVNSAADIETLARALDARLETAQTRIWAMMETPLGILNAASIATAPRMAGFVMGTNDLAKELNCRFRPDRLPMQMALQTCLMAARAAVQGDRTDLLRIACLRRPVGDDVHQRNVVAVHVWRRHRRRRRLWMPPFGILRVPDDAVDLVGQAAGFRDVLGAEPDAIACPHHAFVDAMRGGQDPVLCNQRAAAEMLQLPQRRAALSFSAQPGAFVPG
ncbi:MAG: hypothetical protein HC814_07465 [Rhodobacteraceae bacterium]|nr:hypothetical protein [Paracoccaceae bacterium]